jgi:predicted peptidase
VAASRDLEEDYHMPEPLRRLPHLLYLPQGYDAADKLWPLVLFLHGKGQCGVDLNQVKAHGPPKLIAAKKQFPFILVSPQSPSYGWNPRELSALLDDIGARYRVDRDRVYLTGLSMGGFGTWALAALEPERFVAIVPICGGGNPAEAPKMKDLAIWVFHGAKDEIVPLAKSQEMVDALKEAGSTVKFTVYPEIEHDSWTATYDDPEVWKWLLEQKRG